AQSQADLPRSRGSWSIRRPAAPQDLPRSVRSPAATAATRRRHIPQNKYANRQVRTMSSLAPRFLPDTTPSCAEPFLTLLLAHRLCDLRGAADDLRCCTSSGWRISSWVHRLRIASHDLNRLVHLCDRAELDQFAVFQRLWHMPWSHVERLPRVDRLLMIGVAHDDLAFEEIPPVRTLAA